MINYWFIMQSAGPKISIESESWRNYSDSYCSLDGFTILENELNGLLTPSTNTSPITDVDESELLALADTIKEIARGAFTPATSLTTVKSLSMRVTAISPKPDSPINQAAKIVLYPIMLATHLAEQGSLDQDASISFPSLTTAVVDSVLEERDSPHIIKVLGKGGQSSVEEIEYEGIHYARKTTMSSKEQALSFLFPHPHLITPLFLSPTDGAILPLADGTIKDVVTKPETTSISFTNYLLHILEALHHMHTNGLVHRDIKAANILIQEDKAMVADLGLSAFLKDHSAWNSPDGTPSHIAPELFAPIFIKNVDESKSYLTEKMDVFSFGVMLHELLTGESWIYGDDIRRDPVGICLYLDRTEGKIDFDPIQKTLEDSPLAKKLDPTGFWANIMQMTLKVEPTDRPSMKEIIDLIHQHTN